ncbi:hypothetical protein P3390_24330, partial [Vibrio parahaemolyticus]|nr:hypothetical protein [Vibrio parahaemolyticus]
AVVLGVESGLRRLGHCVLHTLIGRYVAGGNLQDIKNILVYKRTHVGDPNGKGEFGVNDCMGEIRDYDFDAVIGVGGLGNEPCSYGIDRKINWVGIKPTRMNGSEAHRADILKFEKFVLLESSGPIFEPMAPLLAKRLYQDGARFVFTSMTDKEREEARNILAFCLSLPSVEPLHVSEKCNLSFSSPCTSKC